MIKITVTVMEKEFSGQYSVAGGMISVTSMYGDMKVQGTTRTRAEETLREIVRACPDLNWD